MKHICNVRSVDPKSLKESDFKRLQEVSQDLWAYGIWEFVQCEKCHTMHSKQDIFWHLEKERYDETVEKIMKILEIDKIYCTSCWWLTKEVYGNTHIDSIRERLLTLNSHIVIAENEKNEIVWYMDGYLDSIEWIFYREYYSHYQNIWVEFIKNKVHKILGYTPEKILWYSWVWLIEKYSNFYNIFSLMKEFYYTVESIPPYTPALTVIDQNNNFWDLFDYMWYRAIGIQKNSELSQKVSNIARNYKSELIVFEKPIHDYRNRFWKIWIKWFLKIFSKQNKKQNSIPVWEAL